MQTLTTLPDEAFQTLEHVLFPVWVFCTETLRIIAANQATQDWLGYDLETLKSMTIVDIRPETEQALIVEEVQRFEGGTTDAGVWTIIGKNGEHYRAHFNWSRATFKGSTVIVASIRDLRPVAEAKALAANLTIQNTVLRREASLSADHLLRLINGVPGKILVLTPVDYRIVAVSDEYAETFELSRDIIIGRGIFELFQDVPSHPAADGATSLKDSFRRVEAMLVTDTMSLQHSMLRRPDDTGEERAWLPINKPVLNAEGDIIYIIHRLQEVTHIATENELTAGSEGDKNSGSVQLAETRAAILALSEKETRLRSAEILLDLGSWEFDIVRQALSWSPKVFEIYGVPTDRVAPNFERYVQLVHPDDREQMLSKYQHFFDTNAPELEFQHRIIRADGGITFVRGVGSRHYIDGKEIVMGFVQDITLIKQAEQDLLREVERRKLASRLVSLGSWQYIIGHPFLFWDNETAAIHDEPEGTSPSVDNGISYYIPEHQERIRDVFEACVRDGIPFDEVCQIVSAKRRTVWVRAIGEAVRDSSGAIVAVNGAFQDISELIEAQEALKANEERFRLATRAAGSAIWEWDTIAATKWWSDGLQEIFGHQVHPKLSTSSFRKSNVHPDDLTRLYDALDRLASGQDRKMEETYRLRRGDGSWAIVEDRAFAVCDGTGATIRVLGSMTDVTEKKQLEELLHQSQKMEIIGQLTGGIAHDFNNLLTVILGNSEVMTESLSAHPELQNLASMSLEAAERGAQLTNQLLAFSRKQPLEPKVIDVATLVQGMDALLRRTLPERIVIEIVRSAGLWRIDADPSQLESAILNLALNARDAMPQGGFLKIEISNVMLDDDHTAVEPELAPGQYVVLIVKDTGDGIPREIMDRVFEPFFTTKDVGKGSGLGLSMVFGFVKQSGGHVRVYSELGVGTSFELYFPRSRSEPEGVLLPQTASDVVRGSEKILVVEDDPAVRAYVSTQLRGLGYAVYEASSGKEGMELLLSTPHIDLLFTDIVMPGGMSGRELAANALKIRPETAILFTSGHTENAIVHEGRLDPDVILLSKPYRRQQLAAKIREALNSVNTPK